MATQKGLAAGAKQSRIESLHRCDAAHTALLVVDVQHGFLDPGASLEVPKGRAIIPREININEKAIRELLQGSSHVFETITIPDHKDKVRIIYAFLSPSIILQVGQAMESYSRFLDAFKGIFITTMTFLIVFAAGVGWFMARRAVSGVEAVTRTAQKITGGTLEERVPVKARGDEIDQLAMTFNQMLDRIQTLVTEIKEMSDNIAHDLKSPITRIRGIAEVTLTGEKSMGEYEGMAASTIEECDRLAGHD